MSLTPIESPRTVRSAVRPALPAFDMYGPIHKGLRHALARMLSRLGTAAPNEPGADPKLIHDLEELLDVCESHLAHEDRFIHPAIERRRPGATESLAVGHREHEAAVAELRRLISALRAAPDQAPALRRLYLRFAAFVAENLIHMAEEEEVTQPLLDELFTPEEQRAIQEELVQSMSPDEALASQRLMVPAVSRRERVAVLAGPRAGVSEETFLMILSELRSALTDADWYELIKDLGLE